MQSNQMYKIKLLTYCLLLCILSQACKDKQASIAEVAQKPQDQTKTAETAMKTAKKTILCFGNSLTAGHGLDEEKAWPALLQNKLDSIDETYTVINAGLSGETTSGGLNRIDWLLKQQVDYFILELGANDMLRGLDVTKTRENLSLIIERVKAKDPEIPIIIGGMLAPPNMGKEYADQFNQIFPEISMKYKATLIPFFLENVAGVTALNLPDGKHPNEQGQKIVLENVWSALSLLL